MKHSKQHSPCLPRAIHLSARLPLNYCAGVSLFILIFQVAVAQMKPQPADPGAADDEVVQMERFVVTTDLGNYAESAASIATKYPISTLETSAAVQVLNRSFLADLNADDLKSTFSYIAGLVHEGQEASSFNMRGFTALGGLNELRVIQIDGLSGLTSRFGSPVTAAVERVEVLKGPASLLYGLATPGGKLNIVTKSPQPVRQFELVGSVGTWWGNTQDLGENLSTSASLDATGPITKDKRLLYRLIVRGDNTDSWRKFSHFENYYVYPSLTYRWNASTQLTIKADIIDEDRVADYMGVVVPLKNQRLTARYDTFYGEPTDYEHERGQAYILQFDHLFANGWKLHIGERSTYSEHNRRHYIIRDLAITTPIQNSTLRRQYARVEDEDRLHYLDAYAVGDIGPESFTHRLLLGFTSSRRWNDAHDISRSVNAPGTLSVYSPAIGVAPYPADGGGARDAIDRQNEYDGYIADHIKLGARWRPSFGIRYSRKNASNADIIRNLHFRGSYHHTTPNAGLVCLVSPNLSVYGSYSESFIPNSLGAFDANDTNNFPPETSYQLEVGVKGEYRERTVNFIFSTYNIVKQNVLEGTGTFTAAGNSISVLDGEQETKGLEFSGSWLPQRNWQIMATLSYIPFAKITETRTVASRGQRLYSVPDWSGSLWTRYNFTSTRLRGLGFGLGASYVGPREASRTARVPIDGRTVVDAAIYYQLKRCNLALNIDNLLDEKYFVGASTNRNSGINPGQPRRLTFSVRFKH